MQKSIRNMFLLAMLLTVLVPLGSVWAQGPIVRAVLFYSQSCPHCHDVINEHLPPITEHYGDQLQIVGIDTSVPGGAMLFESAIVFFDISPERRGVPMLIVGNRVLVGSYEIPSEFPALIADGLQQGGLDWPALPGLAEALPENFTGPIAGEAAPNSTGSPIAPIDDSPGASFSAWLERTNYRIMLDPLGNSLAIVVLIGMLLSVFGVVVALLMKGSIKTPRGKMPGLPLLSLAGILIAAYLTYIEITQQTAFCGPVGDCNTVQQSSYAMLFGVMPIGVMGLAGYVGIAAAWFVSQRTSGRMQRYAVLAMMGMTFFGAMFSIYLTYLEPFVIGATCMWCILSAMIITTQMWLALSPTLQVLEKP